MKPLWIDPRYHPTVEEGRKISHCGGDWGRVQSFKQGDESLVAVDFNGMWKRAAYLRDEAAFQEMFVPYSQGMAISLDIYALPKELVDDLPKS